MSIGEQEVFVLSERALSDVIDQVQDHQWNQMTPGWFQSGRQGNVSLRGIVHDHAYDWAWVPHVLAGKTMAEVGGAYDGHLLGPTRKEAPAALASRLLPPSSNWTTLRSSFTFPPATFQPASTSVWSGATPVVSRMLKRVARSSFLMVT